MNRLGIIVSLACLMAMAACSPDSGGSIDAEFHRLSKMPVDFKIAQQWFQLAERTPNGDLRQEFLKLSATALLHARRRDVYANYVKPLLSGAQSFEESLRSDCGACDGGKTEVECKHCRGTGMCQYEGCDYGRIKIRIRKFGEVKPATEGAKYRYEKCSSCSGTGHCRYCDGNKSLNVDCEKCGGKGWVVKTGSVLNAYREHLTAATNALELLRQEKRRRRVNMLGAIVISFIALLWLFWRPDWRRSKW